MSTIITKKQFNNHIYKTEIAGRPFSLEFGKVAELANASAMVRYGDTSVLVAVTTFVICVGGFVIGRTVGDRLSGRAEVLGGAILVFIGLEIFIKGGF